MAERRLKHWGWGYEDQAPSRKELGEAAAGIRERFGFGGEPEEPVPLDEVELRAARLKAPSALGDLFTDDHYERVSHALGKAYRDVVRGFRGEFENPPDLVAFPRDESEIEMVLSWAEAEGAAVVPFGGGTSVVGGVEARLGDRPVVSLDLRRLDRVLEVDAESLAARIQAGATGPGLEDQLREHGLTLRHFPQSFEYSTLGGWIATRAGGHFATLYTHIDDLVESVRAITPRGTWESRRLAGVRGGALARPGADRLRGHPRRDRRVLGAGAPAAAVQDLLRGRVRRLPTPRRGRCARSPSPGSIPPTAACSTRSRRARPGPARARRTCWCSASSQPHLPVDEPMRLALDIAQSHGGVPNSPPPGREPASEDRGRRRVLGAVDDLAQRLPARSLPARHLRRLRRAQRDLRDGDHLGPLRGVPRRRRWQAVRAKVAEVCDAPAEGPGAPRVSCRFTHVYPDGPAPYFTVIAPAIRGGEVEQWDEIKVAAGEARDRGRRHDHPPPRRRPRSPSLVRPSAPRPLRRRPARRQGRARPGRHAQPRRPDRPLDAPDASHLGASVRPDRVTHECALP